jgi:hypothetical protein
MYVHYRLVSRGVLGLYSVLRNQTKTDWTVEMYWDFHLDRVCWALHTDAGSLGGFDSSDDVLSYLNKENHEPKEKTEVSARHASTDSVRRR